MTPLPSYSVMWMTRKMAMVTLQNEPHMHHNGPQTNPHEARTPTKPKRGPSGAICERWVDVTPEGQMPVSRDKIEGLQYDQLVISLVGQRHSNAYCRLLGPWAQRVSKMTFNLLFKLSAFKCILDYNIEWKYWNA